MHTPAELSAADAKRVRVSLIAAVERGGGIGRNDALLVRLPDDMKHFKRTTLGSPVVMGRKTWDSIGRPLPGRQNIVLTRDASWHVEGAQAAASIEDALALAVPRRIDVPRIYVIGGAEVYALALPFADELVLTEIDASLKADVFFPAWNRSDFRETSREHHTGPDGLDYSIVNYSRN